MFSEQQIRPYHICEQKKEKLPVKMATEVRKVTLDVVSMKLGNKF